MESVIDFIETSPSVYKEKKVLFVLINDNIQETKFYFPRTVLEMPETFQFVKYVPLKHDILRVNKGVISHPFAIYTDMNRKDAYFLIQEHPVEIVPFFPLDNAEIVKIVRDPKTRRLFKKRTGMIVDLKFDIDYIISDTFYSIAREIFQQIYDEYDYYIFVRFTVDDNIDDNIVNIMFSKDMSNILIDYFSKFSPKLPDLEVSFFPTENYETLPLHLSLYLFNMIPNRKVFYEFRVAQSNLTAKVGDYVVQKVKIEDYLDECFDEIVDMFKPKIM